MDYSKLRDKLRRAGALPLRDWACLLEAWGQLLWLRLGLKLLPFKHWGKRLFRPTETTELNRAQLDLCCHLATLVAIAARHHLIPMHCLHRSLALQRMLARRAIAVRLCLGVRKRAGELVGHAWLQVGTEVIDAADDVSRHYVRLKGYPPH